MSVKQETSGDEDYQEEYLEDLDKLENDVQDSGQVETDKRERHNISYKESSEDEEKPGPGDGNTTDMFASVWLKVEVEQENVSNEDAGMQDDGRDIPRLEEPIIEAINLARQPRAKYKKHKKPTKILKCEHCEYTTVYGNCLKIHIKTHTNPFPYICGHCDYKSKYQSSLQRHMAMKHGVGDGTQDNAFKCTECDYTTSYKWNLKAHQRKHTTNKLYNCELCGYNTSYKHNYEKHSKTHMTKGKAMFRCDKCMFETSFEGHIVRHLAKIHNEVLDNAARCDYCDFSTLKRWRLNIHVARSKQENPIKCNICEMESYYMCQMKLHKNTHPPEVGKVLKLDPKPLDTSREDFVYKCDKCTFETKYEGHIARHLAKIHDEVTDAASKCHFCDFVTLKTWRLNVHLQKSLHHELQRCNMCDFASYYICQLKNHKVTSGHHLSHANSFRGARNPHSLNESTSTPPNLIEEALRQHSLNESANNGENITEAANSEHSLIQTTGIDESQLENNPYNLFNLALNSAEYDESNYELDPTTGEPVKRKERYSKAKYTHYIVNAEIEWSNIRVLESDDKDRPYRCMACDYMSKFKASVQRHYQRHHVNSDKKPFKCINCDFTTKTKDQIALHNKRSISVLELTCSLCEFKTMFKCASIMHQRSHYQYKCEVCGMSYKNKYELQKHFYIHLGSTFKCRYCDYETTRKDSIVSHETIHTGVKPFKCQYCSYTSIRKSVLDVHVKRNHYEFRKDKTIVSLSKLDSLKSPVASKDLAPVLPTNEDLDMKVE